MWIESFGFFRTPLHYPPGPLPNCSGPMKPVALRLVQLDWEQFAVLDRLRTEAVQQ